MDRGNGELGARGHRLRGDCRRHPLQSRRPPAFPLSPASDLGGDFSRRGRMLLVAWRGLCRQFLLLAAQSRGKLRQGPQHPDTARGLNLAHGFAIPMLIAFGVGVVMTFIARRTTFGRYIYALGGNPEAADLAGINTRWITLCTFSLMGVLV